MWNDVSSIPQVIMDTGNAYIYTDGVAPAEQVNLSTGAISYLVTDSLGSVRGEVSGSGTLTATTSYDAWGNPETVGGLSATTPFGYAGGYTDPDGLIYLINRYYDPATGQLISVDPQLAQTEQPYAYADGNPVTNIDPSGLYWRTISSVFEWWTFWQPGWFEKNWFTHNIGNLLNTLSLFIRINSMNYRYGQWQVIQEWVGRTPPDGKYRILYYSLTQWKVAFTLHISWIDLWSATWYWFFADLYYIENTNRLY